ncbi:MAG TPA: hypothetical protein VF746_20275 [Longimicrobium sp.]
MSDRHVPWPVWAIVTLGVAYIGAMGVARKDAQGGEAPAAPARTEQPPSPQPVAAASLPSGEVHVFARLDAPGLVAQEVVVTHEGTVRRIRVDEGQPCADVALQTTGGTHVVELQVTNTFLDSYGYQQQHAGAASQNVSVSGHTDVLVRFDPRTFPNPMPVWLVGTGSRPC